MMRGLIALAMLNTSDRLLLAHAWIRAHGYYAKWYRASWREFLRILAAYSEPHRVFHTVSHLVYGLRQIAEYRDDDLTRAPVHFRADSSEILAWFYHDFVYVIGATCNERKSAVRMQHYALGRIALRDINWAIDHVLYTADPLDHMSSKTVQMDLAVLWAPRDVYLNYADDLYAEFRQQYTHEAFCVEREAFLRRSLEYLDDAWNFHADRTPQAIDNINFELENVLHDH